MAATGVLYQKSAWTAAAEACSPSRRESGRRSLLPDPDVRRCIPAKRGRVGRSIADRWAAESGGHQLSTGLRGHPAVHYPGPCSARAPHSGAGQRSAAARCSATDRHFGVDLRSGAGQPSGSDRIPAMDPHSAADHSPVAEPVEPAGDRRQDLLQIQLRQVLPPASGRLPAWDLSPAGWAPRPAGRRLAGPARPRGQPAQSNPRPKGGP